MTKLVLVQYTKDYNIKEFRRKINNDYGLVVGKTPSGPSRTCTKGKQRNRKFFFFFHKEQYRTGRDVSRDMYF